MIYTGNLGDIWNTVCKWLLPICSSEFYVLLGSHCFFLLHAVFEEEMNCDLCDHRIHGGFWYSSDYCYAARMTAKSLYKLWWPCQGTHGTFEEIHIKYMYMEHVKKYIKKSHGTCKGTSTCQRYLQSCTCLLCRSWNV